MVVNSLVCAILSRDIQKEKKQRKESNEERKENGERTGREGRRKGREEERNKMERWKGGGWRVGRTRKGRGEHQQVSGPLLE